MRSDGSKLPLSYVLPLATPDDADVTELAAYLRRLSDMVDEVIVVDGSSPAALVGHGEAFGPSVLVLAPRFRTPMGKVGNVCTGIEAASWDHVVIADDDVRYRADQLERLDSLLLGATVVRPQNYFDPLPWHARLDTARSLLARVTGGDWPGTLALRRSVFLAAGGYRGDVLFENLELVRTLIAAGGNEHLALDLNVRRIPPTTAHFRSQQIRQAYDEFARPGRLVVSLAVLPAVISCTLRRRFGWLAAGSAAVTVAAEAGRRVGDGRPWYPATSAPLAPPWLLWRSLCSWAALGARLRGGARYRGHRLPHAATPLRHLRDRRSTVRPDHRPLPRQIIQGTANSGGKCNRPRSGSAPESRRWTRRLA